ncbi:hypothetical protein EYF80_055838 [Liparis tanakae]|uniref:Uncharacterized protein n=1 Tax=Liparis tanakae TaxID=230148 RepID=A0A4Z2EYF4_9TELE|nr:hypothetical protein EYF80_055838 [Liparis tanakae]
MCCREAPCETQRTLLAAMNQTVRNVLVDAETAAGFSPGVPTAAGTASRPSTSHLGPLMSVPLGFGRRSGASPHGHDVAKCKSRLLKIFFRKLRVVSGPTGHHRAAAVSTGNRRLTIASLCFRQTSYPTLSATQPGVNIIPPL